MMRREYIFDIKSIPHDWLFPRIHAAVHHGGAGTTGASLRGSFIVPSSSSFLDRLTNGCRQLDYRLLSNRSLGINGSTPIG